MAIKRGSDPLACWDVAARDEPTFTLLARDPLAPFLVSILSSLRNRDGEGAQAKFAALLARVDRLPWRPGDEVKAGEALDGAMAMFAWRRRQGLDPDPLPSFPPEGAPTHG